MAAAVGESEKTPEAQFSAGPLVEAQGRACLVCKETPANLSGGEV